MSLRNRQPVLLPGWALIEVQTAVPNSDIAIGGWTNAVDSTVNLHNQINEFIVDDGDYVKSGRLELGSTDTIEVSLDPLSDPNTSEGHTVRYRFRATGSVGGVHLTVSLRQGSSTEIAAWTH